MYITQTSSEILRIRADAANNTTDNRIYSGHKNGRRDNREAEEARDERWLPFEGTSAIDFLVGNKYYIPFSSSVTVMYIRDILFLDKK